jgi:modulator of FtsH protease HflK
MAGPATANDVNELLGRLLRTLGGGSGGSGGRGSSGANGGGRPRFPRGGARVIGATLLFVLALGAIYQIEAEEVGIVLRFGKVVRQTDPGLHVKVPIFERVRKVPIQRQLKEEFGFRTQEGGETASRYRTVPPEALMLTGDLNVVHAEWVVQYRVLDPIKYLFNVRNPTQTLRALSESVMRQTVGDRTVTEVLTVGRQEIEDRSLESLNDLIDQYDMGIRVVQVIMQDATPPTPVRPAWDSVSGAQQQRERMINEAWAEYNRDVPRAEGEAQEVRLRAEGYALDRVNRAEGEVTRFLAVLQEYRRSPAVTRTRLMLEAQEQVLGPVEGKVFVDPELRGILPLLQLEGRSGQTVPSALTPSPGGGTPR